MKNNRNEAPVLRLHVWLEKRDSLFFGLGRAQLLQNVKRLGSLRKAAMEMNMSYRAAWGKIKKTEEVLGFKLLEKAGGNKAGYRLTKAGDELQQVYLKWYAELESEALQRARKSFPWNVYGYKQDDEVIDQTAEKGLSEKG